MAKSANSTARKVPQAPEPVRARRQYRPSKQQRLRAQLILAGLDLFRRNGFDATTVSDIADAAGISRRTFFRYFESKDDLVFDWLDEQDDFIRPKLAARPAGEPPLVSLRQALLQLAQYLDADHARAALLGRIIFDTPALSRRYHAETVRWEGETVRILQRGRRGATETFAIRVQISIATAAYVTALRAWAADHRGGELQSWVVAAFAALEDGLRGLEGKPLPKSARRKAP